MMNGYAITINTLEQQCAQLLAVAEEIAGDSRCDLIDSERRLRLYAAIVNAGGKL